MLTLEYLDAGPLTVMTELQITPEHGIQRRSGIRARNACLLGVSLTVIKAALQYLTIYLLLGHVLMYTVRLGHHRAKFPSISVRPHAQFYSEGSCD